jgi:hypothetical protein
MSQVFSLNYSHVLYEQKDIYFEYLNKVFVNEYDDYFKMVKESFFKTSINFNQIKIETNSTLFVSNQRRFKQCNG